MSADWSMRVFFSCGFFAADRWIGGLPEHFAIPLQITIIANPAQARDRELLWVQGLSSKESRGRSRTLAWGSPPTQLRAETRIDFHTKPHHNMPRFGTPRDAEDRPAGSGTSRRQ